MWNPFSIRSNNTEDHSPSQNIRRNDDKRRHPANRSTSITSTPSNTESACRADDLVPRGLNPRSSSYSSTTREQHSGEASASIPSSYAATSGDKNGEPHMPPGLARNDSLADQMPSSSRSSRDQEQARKVRHKKRSKTEGPDGRDQDVERRKKGAKQDRKDKSLRRTGERLDEDFGTSRGPGDFPDQVTSSGFSQFPGQYDAAMPAPNGLTHEQPAMSSHVQDQFPGQFPAQASAPYRPPLATSEGGPGLAAEYYGDAGQSVAEQPGNRVDTPSLIVGAEPHLQPALAVAAPPPEPSASGAVGAAASFFSGEFEEYEVTSSHGQQNSSAYSTGQIRPNGNHHSSSAPVIPIIGGAMIGSAAGYLVDNQTSLHQQRPHHESSIAGGPSEHSSIAAHRPPSEIQISHYSSTSQPTKPGKQSSQLSSSPMYAVEMASAAGLATPAYAHNHHSSTQNSMSTSQHSTASMAQRRRNRGPLSALVDFFKDPEGVAQFEEYSQIIGICRHCFAPGSSPRDAPRKHFYGRRRSNERYGSSTRVDKDNRYYSSENEGRRKNKPWLATGIAGFGLAKMGESFFNENDDLDDPYSVKNARFSPDGSNRRARRRSRSNENVDIRIIGDSKSDRKGARDDVSKSTKRTTHSTRRRSRTRSRSKDRENNLTKATIGAASGASVAASSSRPRSRSPHSTSVKSKRMSQAPSPERRHKTKKKRSRGFFSFGSGSSSSSSVDLLYTSSQSKHRSNNRSTSKSKDDKKAEAALLGLGAAAAALALNDGRQGRRKKVVKEHASVRNNKDHDGHGSAQAHRHKTSSGSPDDELWESAVEDDYESINSDLAYGTPARRDSRASLSSESSGTNKWGWRWGSKKHRRVSPPNQKSSDHSSFLAVASSAGAPLTGSALMSPNQHQGNTMTSTSSLPLRHVYPMPTSDPSRFDVGSEAPNGSANRPEAVPLQHPRPIAPVSPAIYSGQMAYDHSYSAPAGVAVFPQAQYHRHLGASGARSSIHEASLPGNLPRFEQQAGDTVRESKIRRRETSPARFEVDAISSSTAPRRRSSAKDDTSAVRFDLTEEQEERERRERRRKREQDKERREAEKQAETERERRAAKEGSFEERGSKAKPEKGPPRPEKSWVAPTAAGVVGAAIASAAAADRSKSEETREERRERRRRERELEDEEDALKKSERRRRQRERAKQETAIHETERLPDEISAPNLDQQERSIKRRDMSVWQEAASTKRSSSHENYGAFFTPLEFLNKSSDRVKVISANADADIDLEQVPQIVTVEPKRTHDLSDSPTFSPAGIDDKIDSSRPSFPWQVPRLRLVEPTPPSTRGSTPLSQPKDAGDEDFEEPRKDGSPSKVKWADDQNREYTIIAPKEDCDEFIEPVSEEIIDPDLVDLSGKMHERQSPDDETHQYKDSATESNSASYGEDVEFAATLAASAEDAGFDPSIVINNPTYRRRDSPPGSNERSMPGAFDDVDELWLKKKQRNGKEKTSRRQGQNDSPDGRDDDKIVQDIISQVEESESQASDKVPSENLHDESKSPKMFEYKKSKKGRKGSGSRDNSAETSDLANKTSESKTDDVYKSPSEEVRSISSTSNEAESDSESREEWKRDNSGLDDVASNFILPSTNESNGSPKIKSKDKRKGSLWDQFRGKSTNNIPQDNPSNVATDDADLEAFDESEKRNRMPKERKPTSGRDDNHDSKGRNSTGSTTPQVLDRLSQELPVQVRIPLRRHALSKWSLINYQGQGTSLPSTSLNAGSVAKYLDHGVELEQVEEKQAESFLGMRPEPPPPPDTGGVKEQLFTSLETTSLPTSPRAGLDTKNRRFSDAEISNRTQTTSPLPSSPTAVPFHFRQPGHPSSTARSQSQTPLSSNQPSTDTVPKQKIRPRSTEFKSSKEIRPLWLVERHRSHHEPTRDEVYPSLPSSHTTSTSSSVVASEEREHNQEGDYEVKETGHKPVEVEHAPIVSHLMQPGLLDSQQATPTASSFHHSRSALDIPSPQARRDLSPEAMVDDNPPCSNTTPRNGILGSILEGSAAVTMNEIDEKYFPSPEGLPQEDEILEHDFNDTGLDTVAHPSCDDNPYQEDFSTQRPKKGKKSKRKAGQFGQGKLQPSLTEAAEAKPSMKAINPDPLSPEDMRQSQEEQDVQDAVDSWSPSVRSSNKVKRGKKGKNRILVEKLPAEAGSSSNAHEPPRNNLGIVVSAEDQQNDSLTREISRKQVVDIMTATPQDADKGEVEASNSSTVVQAPAKIQAEEDRTELKGQTGNKGHMDPSQDDLEPDEVEDDDPPQDNSQTTSFPPPDIPQEIFTQDDLPQDNLRRGELPQFKSQQKIQLQDDSLWLNSPQEDFSQSQSQEALSVQGDLQSGNLPALSSFYAPGPANFEGPLLDKGPAGQQESPGTDPASERHNCGNPTTAAPLQLGLSPRVTPLPDSDDEHELLDVGLRTPILTPLHRYNDEKGVVAVNPLDASHLHDPSAITPAQQGQSHHSPSQADQIDAAEDFTAPSKEIPEMGKEAQQRFSGEDNKTTEFQGNDGPSPNVTASTTLEDDWVKALGAEPTAEIPQGKSETLKDESWGFTNSARGDIEKEASQSSSAENSKTIVMDERQGMLPQMATLGALEDHNTLQLLDESAVDDFFQPKFEPLKDEWTGFNEKEQSAKGEEAKPNFSIANTKTTNIEEESESLSPFATLEKPEYRKALDVTGEPAMHVPESKLVEKVRKTLIDELPNQGTKPKAPEDEWAGFDSKTGKSAQNQRSKTVHLGPGQEESELQSEQQPGTRDDLNASPSFFDMKRAPQISAELGSSIIENSVTDEPKEAFPSNSQAVHTLQKPLEDQTMGCDERKMPGSFEPEYLRLENAFGKAHDGAKSPALDTSVASTNAAEVVQEILAVENNVESATDTKSEAMAISTSMKDATTDSPMEKGETAWDTLKKKKKGKKEKRTETSPWEEPETLQPADVSSPSRQVSTLFEHEPAMDRSIEEDELGRDAPKKKKGKKGKKTEAILWDEPEILHQANVSSQSLEASSRLEQEPAMNRPIEEDELDRDAPKKKKKGKKGKKIEDFFSDESKAVEPVHSFDPPSAMKPSPLEQEAIAEANEGVFSKQSKKDKKNKKGKRKAVSRNTDEFQDEDEDEPNVVPTEVAQDKDLPAIARDFQEENKASGVLAQVSQGDLKAEELHTITHDSWNEFEADDVPTGSLQSDGQVEDQSAVDHSLITNVREEIGSHPVTANASPDNDNVADAPTNVILPSEADFVAPREASITAMPIDFAQRDRTKASRDASLEQGEYSIPPKGKKDKKRSKRSKKSNTFPLDDDETTRSGDGQVTGAKVFEEGELEQTTPSGADVFVEPEQSVPKMRSEQEQDFLLPTKKDIKKSNKRTSFSLDVDVLPALEDEPTSQPKSIENEVPKETFPSSVSVIKEPEANVEALFETDKDRDEIEEAQSDNRKSEDLTTPPEPEPPKDFEDSRVDSSINPTRVSGDHGIVEGKREPPMDGESYPILEHVSTPEVVQKPSSPVTLSLKQPANVPEETLTDHAKESKGNINPPVKADTEFLSGSKPSKKDKKKAKKAKKAQALTWEDDEISQEAKAMFNQSGASNDAAELPINPVSQYGESPSKPEISVQAVESTEIIQQDIGLGENRGHQRNALNETPSQAGHDIQEIVRADKDDSYVKVQKGEMAEMAGDETRSIAAEEAGSLTGRKDSAWVQTSGPVHESEQTSDKQPRGDVNIAAAIRSDHERPAVGLEKEQLRISTEPDAIAEAKDENLIRHAPVQMTEEPRRPQNEADWDEPMTEEQSSFVAPGPAQESVKTYRDMENVADVRLKSLSNDKLIPTIEVEQLDAKEKREYNEEDATELERAIPKVGNVADPEPLEGPDIKKERPVPAIEVEMLDAQEQRNYNEEYAKELERQLSPLHEGEHADSSRDEAITPFFSESSIHSVTGRPYEDDHRPLARPPALEDIIEESGSRPGSVQDTPVAPKHEFQPTKSSKQGKKGKKGKKQQPVIWEDETATLSSKPGNDQGAAPSEGSNLWAAETARPLGLEEPVHEQFFRDKSLASPTGDFDTAYKESKAKNDRSDDYFAIQPSRPAEEDVGSEDTQGFRWALETGPPSTEDRFPAQGMQLDQDVYMKNSASEPGIQDERLAPLTADSHVKFGTVVEPAGEQVEDNFDPALIRTIDKGTKPEEKALTREPPPEALKHEDVMNPEIPTADALNDRSLSRQYSLQQISQEDELSSVSEGISTSRGKSRSTEGIAAAVGLGVGALAAESLVSADLKQERKHGEKANEVGGPTDFGLETAETQEPVDGLSRGQVASSAQEHRRTPELERPRQRHQATPPTPPGSPPFANHRAVAGIPVEEDLGQFSETPEYRDSAIYESGSPIISEEIPHDHTVRDSGYPDTEASPTIDNEVENLESSRKFERGVAASATAENVQRSHSGAQETERPRSTSSCPLEIPVEANSDYDVSESGPRERRKRSRRRSGVAYDSDDSADSGFDIQRRRRRQAMAAEPREPSPVSSTTKDRSSALFDSSPSAREDVAANPQDRGLSPRYDAVGEEPDWLFDREGSRKYRSQELSRERRSTTSPENTPESTSYSVSTDHHEARGASLFGGPRSHDDDLISPSRSPRSSEGRGRQILNTISEGSADESPLRRKDKRALSDVGSPESGVKGRRMRSPPVDSETGGGYLSTHEANSHQPWPAAEEEKRAIEERSRSRNSDQVSTVSSRHSGWPGAAFGQREEEDRRTTSAGSMRSEEKKKKKRNNKNNDNDSDNTIQSIKSMNSMNSMNSIHAIIRTPDQVRSASGLSYRSSDTATPPLRRVDRSASGDLRGASKKDEAKSRAKVSSEINEPPDAHLDLATNNIPSSSTYDPVTDKGKSPANNNINMNMNMNMTDVYVSLLLYFLYTSSSSSSL